MWISMWISMMWTMSMIWMTMRILMTHPVACAKSHLDLDDRSWHSCRRSFYLKIIWLLELTKSVPYQTQPIFGVLLYAFNWRALQKSKKQCRHNYQNLGTTQRQYNLSPHKIKISENDTKGSINFLESIAPFAFGTVHRNLNASVEARTAVMELHPWNNSLFMYVFLFLLNMIEFNGSCQLPHTVFMYVCSFLLNRLS